MMVNNQNQRKEWVIHSQKAGFCLIVIVAGSSLYGLVLGYWRSPLQAFYAAIKLPILILTVLIGTAGISYILSLVMKMKLNFKDFIMLKLSSYRFIILILICMSPILLFVEYNLPSAQSQYALKASILLNLIQVLFLAIAGVLSSTHIIEVSDLKSMYHKPRIILLIWLAIDLFLGAQISWILRPFVSTASKVELLRTDAWGGNFYESVLNMIMKIVS